GNAYEVSVTGLAFCVIGLEKHYVDQPPPVAFPPLVPYGTKGGISFARQGGWPVFRRPQGGCMVFAAAGGIKNGAESAVPPQWNGTSYLPRAKALNPSGRRQPVPDRTLAAQGRKARRLAQPSRP
ncbi:hypothetical protein HMPREF9453_00979, partial [Dialister succinatiphilus YIT 11850]